MTQHTCGPSGCRAEQKTQKKTYRPNVDIVDTPESVLLTADVPGADENSVEVTLEKNVLTIRAAVEPPKFEGYGLAGSEYGIGDYERKFTVSSDVDREGIDAAVKDGVLRLRLPKVKDAAGRKIRVSGG